MIQHEEHIEEHESDEQDDMDSMLHKASLESQLKAQLETW